MNEIWKDVVGYEGLYQVSNMGRVKSLNYWRTGQERLLRLIPSTSGYLKVKLHRDSKGKWYNVHKLVAQAFIPNPNSKPCIDHINTIRTDNRADNLRWVTCKENSNNLLTREHIKQLRKKEVFCEDTIYNSIAECAEHYNVKRTTMNGWLTGQNKMPVDFQDKGLRYYIEE